MSQNELSKGAAVVNLSRRSFLQTIGLGTGGLVLGAVTPSSVNVMAASEPAATSDSVLLNLFVQLAPDNTVTIIAHRSEMGQGIRTSLPQVVADEMQADWAKVSVQQGLGNSDYGSQNTDGSRSVRRFYKIMRETGASARLMLEQAAAKVWQVDVDFCYAENHRVIHRSDNKSLSFGELAEVAATMPVPKLTELKLKQSSEFTYIGKSLPIVDLSDITQGKAQYGIDINLPNMLYASIERCPVIGGGVKQFDDTETRKLTGFVATVEMPNKGAPPLFHPLPGVAVLAENTWAALQARKKLKIVWDKGENAEHDSGDYLKELVSRVNTKGKTVRERGKVDETFAQFERQHSATYTVPYLSHASMEPPMATAWWHDGICEIWAGLQDPQAAQKAVGAGLGIDPDKVKVHVTLLGGGFGRKAQPDFAVEAAFLAKQTQRPVKVTWTREDDLQFAYFHAISAQYYQAALDKKGRVKAWLGRSAFPSIQSTFKPNVTSPSSGLLSLGFGDIAFELDHLRCEKQSAKAHIRIGWMRSVSNIQHAFGICSFVDELAREAKIDPKKYWLTLIGSNRLEDPNKDGFKYSNYGESLDAYPINTRRLKNVLIQVANKSGYRAKTPKGEGWGLAVHRSFLSYVAIATRVHLVGGRVEVVEMHCTIDCGQTVNPDRVASQMEGSMIFGLNLALMGNLDVEQGQVTQSNFHDAPLLRLTQCPKLHVHIVQSDDLPAGVGEPGVPPAAPSITNAIVAAGGKRIRELPINRYYSV